MGGAARIGGHAHLLKRLVHPHPDIGGGDAQILRAEGHVLLHDGGDQLIVRVLEHHAHLLPDGQQVPFVLRIETVHQHLPLCGEQEPVYVLG